MAKSGLLGTAAACVILFSFAAGHRKSYWSGCIKAAILICRQIFSILGLVIFRLKVLLKVLQNRLFFALASRSGFGAATSDAVARSSFVFRNAVSAGRSVACVILLSFAAGSRK